MIDLNAHGLIASSPPRPTGGPASIARLLDPLLEADPERLVLVGRHGRFTVTELHEATARAAHALTSLGVSPGDRVAASLPNDTAIVVAFLGAMRIGAIWLGLNQSLAAPEQAFMLADSQASVFLGDRERVDQIGAHRHELPHLAHLVVVEPGGDDEWADRLASSSAAGLDIDIDPLAPAAIAYTSGTTGFPKGAVHTQHNLLLPGAMSARRGLADPGGVVGVPLPLTVLNLMVLGPLLTLQTGMRTVAMDRVDSIGMAAWIERERITTFAAVPAMVHDLLTNPAVTDQMLASIEAIGVGGADMPDAFRRLYQERFGRRVGTGYGLTEAPTSVTMEDPSTPAIAHSCGPALPHLQLHILDVDGREVPEGEIGEVCVGPATTGDHADLYRPMLGYWNRPDASAEALRGGVLHTGDMGFVDAEGNLFIKDRKHDLIIRGGANVYPAEVERVLHDDPDVAACAVIGQPDERLGERVVAFVELRPGALEDEPSLLERCQANLARYKVPDTITFVPTFERTPMGKIRKTVLRQPADAGDDTSPSSLR